MSDRTFYCTGKGLPLAVCIIVFFMIGAPFGIMLATNGADDYFRNCKMSPATPCFGLAQD